MGEVVCHLIDELLNVELFRREYQFGMPKIPPDDESLEEDQADDNMDGEQEMFGIKIRQETDRADLVNGSPTKTKRKRLQSGKIEETKINFFDPGVYGE